jgi:hypothetical protein
MDIVLIVLLTLALCAVIMAILISTSNAVKSGPIEEEIESEPMSPIEDEGIFPSTSPIEQIIEEVYDEIPSQEPIFEESVESQIEEGNEDSERKSD